MRRVLVAPIVVAVLVSACHGDAAVTTAATGGSAAPTSSSSSMPPEAAGTTTATEPGPTEASAAPPSATTGFSVSDLPELVTTDGDPWPVAVTAPRGEVLTIDDIWPEDSFPAERAVYQGAGFRGGYAATFLGDPDGLLVTGAHLFESPAGAAAAIEALALAFGDPDLVASTTQLRPGSLTGTERLPDPGLGDWGVAVRLTGPARQVVVVMWTTHDLLQFVRAGMVLGDADRELGAFQVATAMASRAG